MQNTRHYMYPTLAQAPYGSVAPQAHAFLSFWFQFLAYCNSMLVLLDSKIDLAAAIFPHRRDTTWYRHQLTLHSLQMSLRESTGDSTTSSITSEGRSTSVSDCSHAIIGSRSLDLSGEETNELKMWRGRWVQHFVRPRQSSSAPPSPEMSTVSSPTSTIMSKDLGQW